MANEANEAKEANIPTVIGPLPVLIWDKIIDLFNDDVVFGNAFTNGTPARRLWKRLSNLKALRLTCKAMSFIVKPVLFKSIRILGFCGPSFGDLSRSIFRWLNKHPGHAALVKRLCFAGPIGRCPDEVVREGLTSTEQSSYIDDVRLIGGCRHVRIAPSALSAPDVYTYNRVAELCTLLKHVRRLDLCCVDPLFASTFFDTWNRLIPRGKLPSVDQLTIAITFEEHPSNNRSARLLPDILFPIKPPKSPITVKDPAWHFVERIRKFDLRYNFGDGVSALREHFPWLYLMRRLEVLHIRNQGKFRFHPDRYRPPAPRSQPRVARIPIPDGIPANIKKLYLGPKLHIGVKELETLLTNNRGLEVCDFDGVLLPPTWDRGDEEPGWTWGYLFATMAAVNDKLRVLSIKQCGYSKYPAANQPTEVKLRGKFRSSQLSTDFPADMTELRNLFQKIHERLKAGGVSDAVLEEVQVREVDPLTDDLAEATSFARWDEDEDDVSELTRALGRLTAHVEFDVWQEQFLRINNGKLQRNLKSKENEASS